MDWNTVLIFLCSGSALLTLVQLLATPHPQWGWVAVCLVVLTVEGATYSVAPDFAGWMALGVWGPFMFAPSMMHRIVNKAAVSVQFARAYRWANVAKFLHPMDGWWQNAEMLHGMVLVDRGESERALAIFHHLRDRPGSVGLTAELYVHRLEQDWEGVVQLARAQPSPKSFLRSAQFLPLYLRALGELGRFDEMADAYDKNRRIAEASAFAGLRAQARWMLLAYAGRTRSMTRLLQGHAKTLSPDRMKFWFARAEIAAGRFEQVEPLLGELARSTEHTTADAAKRLLASPPPPATFGEPQRAILDMAEEDALHEMRYSTTHHAHPSRPIVTYVLIAINVAMFGVEAWKGVTENEMGLVRLGAATTLGFSRGQWWRMISANFLHFGSAHIAMNMLGLLVLGPMVERNLGKFRYLAMYLLAGIGAVAGAVTIMRMRPVELLKPEILVGASGAIMGLVGAQAAILLWGWTRDRAHIAGRNLQILLLIVVVQVIFDHMNAQVSGSAHLIGMGIGFLITLAVILMMPKRLRHFET